MKRRRSDPIRMVGADDEDTPLLDLTDIRGEAADDPAVAADFSADRAPGAPALRPQPRQSLDRTAVRRIATRAARAASGGARRPAEGHWPSSGRAQRRLEDFILATSDWVWETDEYAVLTYVSERIAEILGYPAAELNGAYLFDLGAAPADSEEALLDLVRSRRPFRNKDFEIRGADGRLRRCSLSGVPVFDPETGRFVGYRGTGTDVTARFEAEQAARTYRQKLEHALEEIRTKNMYLELALNDATAATRAKSDFLAIVSHELRTPLNAIIGFTDIMQRSMFGPIGNDRYRDYLENIAESADHLLNIIADILDMSKIESGNLRVQDEEIAVGEIVRSAWKLMADRALDKGIRFATIIPENLPRLRADARVLRQMLINLLSNGIKFTPPGGSITVGAGLQQDGGLAIRVSDTGIGIEQEDFDTVLTPFGQVENAYRRTREGTGLGLPLVKSMIEVHGGRLDLESQCNVGTTVTLFFPPERVLAN